MRKKIVNDLTLAMAPNNKVNPLWKYFENSGRKPNGSHYITYCKACVGHHLEILSAEARTAVNDVILDAGAEMLAARARFEAGM